jgi:hypothetical protein
MMIEDWLKRDERHTGIPKFFIFDLTEDNLDNLDDLKKFLAKQVLIHLANPSRLIRIFKSRPVDELTDHIINSKLPPEDARFSPKQSFWAEILSAEISERMDEFMLPIYKLRYKDSRDKAMRGKADVLACKIVEDKPIIIFSEVKSKSVYISPKESKKLATEAFDGVCSNNTDFPEIVDYISERIEDLPDNNPNKYFLMDLFDNAVIHPTSYTKDFRIFFIFEKEKWKEECLEIFDIEKIKELPTLTINIVLIDYLKDLIDNTYLLVPKAAKEIVYG